MKKNWKKGRLRPPKHGHHSEYHKVWRIVDGAIRDTFQHHPEYLSETKYGPDIGRSLAKRITGAILGSGIYSLAEGSGVEPEKSGD